MTRKTVRIAMNGVTGRMGYRQHLVRSLLALREQGGLDLGDGTVLWPEPVLVGRREPALKALADQHGLEHYSTDLDAVLADDTIDIYFDAQVTSAREEALKKAIAAGKHIYTEKPTATGFDAALELARLAHAKGIKHGVVQDKIFLPGLLKLKRLIDGGFFGKILSVRGEFGYWVFEGDWQSAQRPSWNYRTKDGGGMSGLETGFSTLLSPGRLYSCTCDLAEESKGVDSANSTLMDGEISMSWSLPTSNLLRSSSV